MHGRTKFPRIERGYLIIFLLLMILAGVVIYACWFQYKVTMINYEIEKLNYQLAEAGVYSQVPYVVSDFSIYNWIITALSTAFAITASAQLIKKSRCNVYEYAEKWVDKWFKDPEVRPYIAQVVQSWIGANSNTLNINK